MKLLLHGNSSEPDTIRIFLNIIEKVRSKGDVLSGTPLFNELCAGANLELYNQNEQYDFIISIGGDGTFLTSLKFAIQKNIPLVGINAGRMGFLASVPITHVEEAIESLHKKTYKIEKRTLLHCQIENEKIAQNFGLNDFTVLKRDSSSMIAVDCIIDDKQLNRYWADGLIVSTPTGSTGYSLSCGGPIVDPSSQVFVVTPVSPHNLNVRPIIISDDTLVRLKIHSRSEQIMVSIDSKSYVIPSNAEIRLSKKTTTASVVNFSFNNYLNTLRTKLNWGFDARN